MTASKDTGKVRTALISRARELSGTDSSFANFIRLTVESIDVRDLAGISPEIYESILKHSYTRLGKREADHALINIWMADGDAEADPVTIIDIYVDDMPFLVDSILGAVRAHGGEIRLMAHPVLPVEMTKSGIRVLAEPAARSESYLQVHISPVHDEQEITALFNEIEGVLNEVRASVRGWRPMLER
jgi:glutamate dehydrogenase